MIKYKAFIKSSFNPSVMAELVTYGYGWWTLGGLTSHGIWTVILQCNVEDVDRLTENMDLHIGISAYREINFDQRGSNTMERTET